MKRRLFAFLLALCLSFIITRPWSVTATDYGTYDNLILSTFSGHIIGFWPLNETSGTVANDISGNGHNGTYYSTTLNQVDGAGTSFGKAPLFDGINDYVDLTSTGLIDAINVNEFTLAAWIKIYQVSDNYQKHHDQDLKCYHRERQQHNG